MTRLLKTLGVADVDVFIGCSESSQMHVFAEGKEGFIFAQMQQVGGPNLGILFYLLEIQHHSNQYHLKKSST